MDYQEIKRMYVKDEYDFAEVATDFLDEYDDAMVGIVGNYEVIKALLEAFIRYGIGIDTIINMEDPEVDGYQKEYILEVSNLGVAVEKVWREKNEYRDAGYITFDDEVVFIHEDCNSKVLKHASSDVVIEFGFDEELDNYEVCVDGKCCECDCCREHLVNDKDNGEISAMVSSIDLPEEKLPDVKTNETYYINGNKVTKQEFKEREDAFNKKVEEFEKQMEAWRKELFYW